LRREQERTPVPKRPRRSRDPVQAAHQVYLEIIGEASPPPEPEREKSPAAVARGKRGGAAGGPARAARLSPQERTEIARIAAEARWKKTKG
jgi:hypothetical protein